MKALVLTGGGAKGAWQAGEYLESSGRLISKPAVFQVESMMIILTENEKKLKETSERK